MTDAHAVTQTFNFSLMVWVVWGIDLRAIVGMALNLWKGVLPNSYSHLTSRLGKSLWFRSSAELDSEGSEWVKDSVEHVLIVIYSLSNCILEPPYCRCVGR